MNNFFKKLLKIYSICLSVKLVVSTGAPVDTAADAKAILDSKLDPKIIASILPYRTQPQCSEINSAIAKSNSGKPLVDPKYKPLMPNAKPYDDLVFALVNDPMTVFSMYIGHYLEAKDDVYFIMLFIQIEDRAKFKQTYNSQHDQHFDDAIKQQKPDLVGPFQAWSECNRKDVSVLPNNKDDSCEQGGWLTMEKDKWNEGQRTGLEGMLMKHTIKYAQNGIRCYGNIYNPPPKLSDDIANTFTNADLVNLYTSLVSYIENDNDYLARKLHDHCDETDKFTLWIVVLTTRRTPEAMKALDEAFRAAFNGVAIKDFVLKCNCQDAVFKDMLAALIDQSYKPATQGAQDD